MHSDANDQSSCLESHAIIKPRTPLCFASDRYQKSNRFEFDMPTRCNSICVLHDFHRSRLTLHSPLGIAGDSAASTLIHSTCLSDSGFEMTLRGCVQYAVEVEGRAKKRGSSIPFATER